MKTIPSTYTHDTITISHDKANDTICLAQDVAVYGDDADHIFVRADQILPLVRHLLKFYDKVNK